MSSKKILFKALGYVFCIAPAVITMFLVFPQWFRAGNYVTAFGGLAVSGAGVLMIFIAFFPALKGFREWLKSPSIWFFYAVAWVFIIMIRPVIDGMEIVTRYALIGSVIGAFFFRLAGGEKK